MIRLAAVIGDPIEHSRSPAMQNAAFLAAGIDAVMLPLQVAAEDLAAAIGGLRAIKAIGASITIPHKVAMLALCDELSIAARTIGAVNCVAFSAGRIVGHNTDAAGFVDGLSATVSRCVVLGGGGAARAIAHGYPGAIVVARRPEAVTWTTAIAWTDANLRAAFADAELVVDTTPVGLHDHEPHGIPLEALPPTAIVASLIYHREPALLRDARARGLVTHDGRAMLAHQGARAFTIWTGRPAPIDVMLATLARA